MSREIENLFPVGSTLKTVSVIDSKKQEGETFMHNLVILTFSSAQYCVLQSLAKPDRISLSAVLSYERRQVLRSLLLNPAWSQEFIGKELEKFLLTKNQQNQYQKLTCEFRELGQSLNFISQNSLLKVHLEAKLQTEPSSQSSKSKQASLLNRIKINSKLFAS